MGIRYHAFFGYQFPYHHNGTSFYHMAAVCHDASFFNQQLANFAYFRLGQFWQNLHKNSQNS